MRELDEICSPNKSRRKIEGGNADPLSYFHALSNETKKSTFDRIDTNGDGVISRKEWNMHKHHVQRVSFRFIHPLYLTP